MVQVHELLLSYQTAAGPNHPNITFVTFYFQLHSINIK